jgi:hypothetical protein
MKFACLANMRAEVMFLARLLTIAEFGFLISFNILKKLMI